MLITHDLTVVRKTSDRICVMRYGKIVERGITEDVFNNPQHEYTKHLINSEPSGEPDPYDASNKDYIIQGQQCTVKFTLKKGNFFNQKKCDGVIAFGGGSGLDVGKAIAFMSGQNLPIWDFEDIGDNWTRANNDMISPIIAVPTTAGTGSETVSYTHLTLPTSDLV